MIPPLGHPARHLASVSSTMTEAAAWAARGAPHGALVVAETQTAGRGRHGRTWADAPGASLMFSLVLRPAVPPERLGLVGLAAALATAETAEALGAHVQTKWPNDVLARTPAGAFAKLAGVLAEAQWARPEAPVVVLGVGVNVRQTHFPDGLDAVSLCLATGRDVARLDPLAPLLARLARHLDQIGRAPAAFVRDAEARLGGLGETRTVRYPGTGRPPLTGTLVGLAPDGALRLDTGGAVETVYAGEVTLAP